MKSFKAITLFIPGKLNWNCKTNFSSCSLYRGRIQRRMFSRTFMQLTFIPVRICACIMAGLIISDVAFTQTMAENPEVTQSNCITIYVISSARQLSWDSPSSLLRSYTGEMVSTFFRHEKTMIGHLFVKISSSQLPDPLLVGIVGSSAKERKQLVLKDKIGLAILGEGMKSRMQYSGELGKKT